MRKSKATNRETRPVEEQAAAWLLEFETGNPDESVRRAFVLWLKESPRHIEEFIEISAIQLALSESPEMVATVDELVAEASGNVVNLEESAPPAGRPRRFGRWARITSAAAGIVLAVATAVLYLGGYTQAPEFDGVVYETRVGEQRSIVLSDESTLTLNTQSRVAVMFKEDGRHVSLLEGEAMFEVSSDPERPFSVNAGYIDVLVVGTVFNIRRHEEQAVLTVVEGEVGVQLPSTEPAPQGAPGSSSRPGTAIQSADRVAVIAGEQVSADDIGVLEHNDDPNIQSTMAWLQRRLEFENDSMAYVFEEFNRYNQRKLVLDYPQLAERKISGVFDVRDTKSLLQFVQSQSEVSIIHTPSTIVVSELR